jgi:tetratricopeptide (TPR) repeat protein
MSESAEQLERQIVYYLRKYELSPHSRAFAPLADLYRKVGRLEEAIEILTAGLADHPQYVSALVILGRCHHDAGRPHEARNAFDRVLLLDPDNLVALKQLAAIALDARESERAGELLGRVVQLDPTDERAEAELAALRQPAGASSEIPESSGAPLAESQTYRPEPRQAPPLSGDAVAETAESEAPPPPARERQAFATKTLAEIYLAQGYREKAIAVLRQILQRHPDRDDVKALISEIEGKQASAAGAPEVTRPATAMPGPNEQRSRVHFESWLQKVSKADGEA